MLLPDGGAQPKSLEECVDSIKAALDPTVQCTNKT